MRSIFRLWVISIPGIVLSSSCAKPNTTPGNTNTNPFISATVNGTSVTSTTVAAAYANGILQAEGAISTAGSLEISTDSTAPATYTVTSTSINGFEYSKDGNTAYRSSPGGTLVIKSYSNKTLTGTFQGWAKNVTGGSDSVNITNGAFNIKLQ